MPRGDVTTLGTTTADGKAGTADILAVDDLVFVGTEILPHCFGSNCRVNLKVKDGAAVSGAETLATVEGPLAELLTCERVTLNLLQRLAGIATLTAKYVQIARPKGVKILDTRKTTPGLRLFEKYAVALGGGYNHRLDLSSGILIKDNHLLAAGGVTPAVIKCRSSDPNLPIELEVDTFDQLREGLTVGVDGFLLDNMEPATVREAVKIIRSGQSGDPIFIEASGGITLKTLSDYVDTGIDAVSVGALTHSAGSRDIRMDFK